MPWFHISGVDIRKFTNNKYETTNNKYDMILSSPHVIKFSK